MVSSPHEAMHRIFQHDTHLFSRVSKVLGCDLPVPDSVTILPTDLTETGPVERRVDTLLRFDSVEHGDFLLAIEAQGNKNLTKPASWAYYTAYLWSKYRLPTALMVVVQDHATAAWAQQSVASGPPQLPTLTIRPLVAGPHNMPMITDPTEAAEDLVLATLAAITHAGDPAIGDILKTLSTALKQEREDTVAPIIELITQGLGKRPAKELWRNLVAVDLSFYKSDLAEELRDEGREKGREEGREEGLGQGRVEGSVNTYVRVILATLERRGIDVSADVRERIAECSDLELLHEWFLRAATATSAAEIFGDE
ncbi:hypothetical protein SAMN04487983_105929 [Streptomyces sp. yr375]|uniref:hypothetical protein n=1 Tax=Streptomyces sp. yr375 TaxID=1761906 RepID=UPI0008CF237D|nr:hypothetical protein [Streptomyces sp. yr375]SES46173.1 hypothetical protein SAMN04487983_105929 [Streptomyces sp. yr375]